jgi:LPXTG-site transpeptidase (sortase) family protein
MKANNYVALPLLAMGIALTLFSFYWLDVHEPQRTPMNPPALTVDSFEGWVPPMQPVAQESSSQTSPASSAPIARVSVPRVGINAPVEVLSLDQRGAMQDPRTPTAVAWYDFSARPGQLGNVVLAGHVDYHNYGPAVFWRLRDLKRGDRVDVTLADGTVFNYEVASLNYYDAATAPVREITGPTPVESITLITCGGNFNRSNLSYNQRLIVRATRVDATASSQ